jgi:tetratricopeptide (TPR) repeat protein
MKNKKKGAGGQGPGAGVVPAPSAAPRWALWSAIAAVIAAWWAYAPSLNGLWVFDDTALPFLHPYMKARFTPLSPGVRPVTMFTYWVNVKLSGEDSFSYHVVGLLIHLIASGLVFLIARRLIEWAGITESRRDLLAGFAAAVFLLHPAQTEAVAYVAGRSEALSVMFLYAAFALFVCRKSAAVSWATAAGVLVLFGLGVLSKEHVVVLPAWLLLTDFWWNPRFSFKGIRANWRLYVPVAAGAAAGFAMFWGLLFRAETAGFGMKDLTWYQYLFTEFRALFVYLGTFVFPAHLTADWDFPISRSITEHGAVFGLAALVALAVAAWMGRRRFPLASYGFFVFLLLMAPTSSILPIKDPVAERRLYTSMIGLLLVAVDLIGRARVSQRALAGICAGVALLAGIATRARAEVWSNPIALWEDTVRKSPNKPRAYLQLAQSYYDAGEFAKAVETFERVSRIEKPEYNTLVNWALALQRLGRFDESLTRLRQAAALEPTAHVWSQIGMIYAQRGQRTEALDALGQAEKLDPKWAPTYNYRAKVHFQANELSQAVADYQRALSLDPSLTDARDELMRAQAQLRAAGGK